MMSNNESSGKARLSRALDHIIDKDGRRVEYDDPRIVHIGAVDGSRYTKQLMARVYEKKHKKLRTIPATSAETLQLARKLCSGRECVPMTAMVGAVLNDMLHLRTDDEISMYFTLDQTGPCQNGAWPAVWESMAKRLDAGNAIFGVWPSAANHRLGLGNDVVRDFITCYILGDFFDEAENALRVLARDKRGALALFEAGFKYFAARFLENKNAVEPALKKWAADIARIPLAATVEQTPKVLIFGGLNLQFVHYPLTQYFIDQGIIPKVVDAAEGMLWLSSESIMRNGFAAGRVNPKKQFSLPVLLGAWLFPIGDPAEARKSLQDRIGMYFADRLMKRFRKIMEKSGLMVDVHIAFPELAATGHPHVTYNGFTETAATVGRYLCSVRKGHYDGLMNIGSFNCQPAMNAQAILRPLANKCNLPYAAIDCEGPWLSANQRRLLETIAVAARRGKAEKG